ncbi:MAG: OmpA family protein, partial [Chitinophagaceae bacterium]
QWLVFTAQNRPDGYGNFDLYISYLTQLGWSEAKNLGGLVNSDQWDAQPCLSPDKKELYFASRRFGGFGGSDIYVSRLQPNGRWGEPKNMGAGINTAGDDQCPFIHADNQTLFFTSNGWQGYGGNDLFYVKKGYGDTWSKPKNLGYPINTIDDEGTLFVAADGKTAYYASDRSDSHGSHDVYSFELREDLRPIKTLWVKGKVTNKKTGKGISSSVELIDLAGKKTVSKILTDETGNYFITLPVGKDYAFIVNEKGYLFYSDNFLMASRTPDSVYQKDIALQPIESNASIILKNIFFDVNKYDLEPQSQVELEKLVQLLNENPTLNIEISGHTDNVGKPADNLLLSNNRAKSVINYLISKNISPQRLTAKGYGETKPVADNNTEDGMAMNRRTEMKVVSR